MNLVSIDDLSGEKIASVLELALSIKQSQKFEQVLKDKVVASCFFEASTRTRLSFEAAASRMGAKIIGFSDAHTTSYSQKGESLDDSMQVIASLADLVIMRHPESGSAMQVAQSIDKPFINAGDGANEHPTQTLLDLFAIQETQGRTDNLTIGLVGDLHYSRTIHSLIKALAHHQNTIVGVAPGGFDLPFELIEAVEERGSTWSMYDRIEDVIPEVDIIYMTRLQRERYDKTRDIEFEANWIMRPDLLNNTKANMKILHPLPRREELPVSVDAMPQAYYFQQAKEGQFVRAALMQRMMNDWA